LDRHILSPAACCWCRHWCRNSHLQNRSEQRPCSKVGTLTPGLAANPAGPTAESHFPTGLSSRPDCPCGQPVTFPSGGRRARSPLAQLVILSVIPPGPTAPNQTALNGMPSQPELPRPYWTGLSGRLAVTKGYGSSWIFGPCLSCANAVRRVQYPAFSLVSPNQRAARRRDPRRCIPTRPLTGPRPSLVPSPNVAGVISCLLRWRCQGRRARGLSPGQGRASPLG
jgi:hypothetical protein